MHDGMQLYLNVQKTNKISVIMYKVQLICILHNYVHVHASNKH